MGLEIQVSTLIDKLLLMSPIINMLIIDGIITFIYLTVK